jgi:5-methylcytosine-specific restriction endonuclease McrA
MRARRSSARRSPTAGNRGQGSKWLHPATRRRIYERDGWRCVWCTARVTSIGIVSGVSVIGASVNGCTLRLATVDHIVPRARGGSNRSSNLITACMQCNAKRGHRSVPAFAVALCGAEDPALVGFFRHLEPIQQIVRRVRATRRRKLPRSVDAG